MRRAHVLPRRVEAGDRPFELAAAFRQPLGKQRQDIAAEREGRIVGPLLGETLLQNLQAQLLIERADLGDEATLQARAHALVEPFDVVGRARRSDDHLPPAVEQRVDDVVELLLGALTVHELQVVDQQHVDAAELLLEGQRVLAAQRFDELIAEALGREIEHLRVGRPALHLPGDGVQQMRLAEADRGVDVERIEAGSFAERRFGDLRCTGVRHAVRRADDEAVERVARIERRAFEAADARASGRRHAKPRTSARADRCRSVRHCARRWPVRQLLPSRPQDARWRCCPAGAASPRPSPRL